MAMCKHAAIFVFDLVILAVCAVGFHESTRQCGVSLCLVAYGRWRSFVKGVSMKTDCEVGRSLGESAEEKGLILKSRMIR